MVLRIALMDGEKPLGEGLALRLAEKHEIMIGSWTEDVAREKCEWARSVLQESGRRGKLDYSENYKAIEEAEVVVTCSGYERGIKAVEELVASFEEQIVISTMVPTVSYGGEVNYVQPREGSAALQLDSMLPESTDVVACLHAIPPSRLKDLTKTPNFDVPVFSDSKSAKKKAFDLIRDIRFLKPLDGGSLNVSCLGEMMGALIANVATINRLRDPSFKFPE